jgi:hypothetical protein
LNVHKMNMETWRSVEKTMCVLSERFRLIPEGIEAMT